MTEQPPANETQPQPTTPPEVAPAPPKTRKPRTTQSVVEATPPEQATAEGSPEDAPLNEDDLGPTDGFDPNDRSLTADELRAANKVRREDRSVYSEEARKAQEAADPSLIAEPVENEAQAQ